jgi:hypothetical protein
MLAQDQLLVEPILQTFLSLVIPITNFPSSKLDNQVSLRLLFWLVVLGNTYLMSVLILIYSLYNFNLYNPWCTEHINKLLVPEVLMDNIHILIVALFASATVPVTLCFVTRFMRYYLAILYYRILL